MSLNNGTLYIVATPIGNKHDITYRAVETLKSVDLIAAEDKRHSRPLLDFYQINTPMIAVHDHNERDMIQRLQERLRKGHDIALISDAGTPLINDPGYPLVKACRQQGFIVIPIPGVSAVICALSAAGLPTDRFLYEGFPPRTQTARQSAFEQLKDEACTLIFYESRHRIQASIDDMAKVFGQDRYAVIGRELTKTYETFLAGNLSELQNALQQDANQRRGEFVIMLHGNVVKEALTAESQRILQLLVDELPTKKAAALTAKITGDKKNKLYQLAVELKI